MLAFALTSIGILFAIIERLLALIRYLFTLPDPSFSPILAQIRQYFLPFPPMPMPIDAVPPFARLISPSPYGVYASNMVRQSYYSMIFSLSFFPVE